MGLGNIETTFEFDPCTNCLVTPRLPVQDVTWQEYERYWQDVQILLVLLYLIDNHL